MSTEQQRQRLSALVDGEVGRFEAAAAISDVMRSPDLAECWERWHLIGRALRGEPSSLAARGVEARVRAAADTQALGGRGGRPRAPLRAWRPVGGAIAAGLAMLGLALLVKLPTAEQPGRLSELAAASGREAPERWQQPDPAVRARLDRLLVTHQEQVAGLGSPGVAAYAAVIGYERQP
jgi:sigma-E factor negative regulatory protein RseA